AWRGAARSKKRQWTRSGQGRVRTSSRGGGLVAAIQVLRHDPHLRPGLSVARLDAHRIVAPPGTPGPVEPALPRLAIVFDDSQQRIEGGEAIPVRGSAEFAEDGALPFAAQPIADRRKPLTGGGRIDAGLRRARAVGVEILVDLVDE